MNPGDRVISVNGYAGTLERVVPQWTGSTRARVRWDNGSTGYIWIGNIRSETTADREARAEYLARVESGSESPNAEWSGE